MICAEHQVEFKGPNSRGNLWHLIDFATNQYCNLAAPKPVVTPSMEQKTEEIKQTLATPTPTPETKPYKGESYKIQKQHSQEMAIRFLDYCKKHSLTPAEEIKNVESWTKIFMEDLEI